jgi:nucleoside-diphosphate-sugar epimerase
MPAMRIVVTGACGQLGQAVVKLLYDRGFDVQTVDRESPREVVRRITEQGRTDQVANKEQPPGKIHYRQADLAELGQVYGCLAGATAVIHLGAIPSPAAHPPEVVFRNNVVAQFNVFEAAATLGIRRVVSASSVSALGFPWQHRWSEPLFFPIDESHPLLSQDAYGLSKVVGEEIAAAYCRRGAGSAASLRFSTIIGEDRYTRYIEHVKRDVAAQANMLWSYVDLRDAARACLLALDAQFEGHAPLFITASDTSSDLPTDELLRRCFPRVPRRSMPSCADEPVADRWSLIDCTRARDLLGYRPAYHWPEILAAQTGRKEVSA